MRMLDARAVIGAARSPIMWQNGTQPLWKAAATKLNVRTGTDVESIQRNSAGVTIHVKGRQAETFDKVIMAVDPKVALKILDSTEEENSLFSQVKYTAYSTFAVRVDGISDGKAQVGYLKENMNFERVGRPMAWIKRYDDDNVFIFHLFAPKSISDEDVMRNIRQDMQAIGATDVKYVESRRWSFFPHVDSIAMREKFFFERVRNLQGQNNTVFVNEALGMSTMPDSYELGLKTAQRLASGEY